MPSGKILKTATTFLLLIFTGNLLAMGGRALADRWPEVGIYRELELRGDVPIQPNVWPDRSGVVLKNLPDNLEGTSGFWAEKLRNRLVRTEMKPDTVTFFIEPGINGILNNPRESSDRFYPTLRFGGGMTKSAVEGFVAYVVNLRWAQEENYRGRQWAGFAGRPDQVYIRASGEDWALQFGKDYLSWGEGLMCGKDHVPFEMLNFDLRFGYFNLSGFTGFLDPSISFEPMPVDTFIKRTANRYLAGHRLEFIAKRFTIALNEEMLYGGMGRIPEISYIVPFYWYHAEQLNRGFDDNTFIGGDFKVLFPPVRFTGEVLVDDIQVESNTQDDEEPPEIGLAGQLDYGATIFSKWATFSARYEGVTNWTYNQSNDRNRYIYQNECLGSSYDNDYDRTSLGLDLYLASICILNLEGFYFRKGEGRIDAPWTSPWSDIDGPYSEPFPTGIVEKTGGFKVDWQGFYENFGFWKFGFEYGRQKNQNHEKNKDGDYWQLDLQLDLTFNPTITF